MDQSLYEATAISSSSMKSIDRADEVCRSLEGTRPAPEHRHASDQFVSPAVIGAKPLRNVTTATILSITDSLVKKQPGS